MSRRESREAAVQTLFAMDLNSELTLDDMFLTVESEREKLSAKSREYSLSLIEGTKFHLTEIDELLAKFSSGWKVKRMAAVDRAILRLAVYELKFSEEGLSPGIVINEAVELAKIFGTDESARFINGVLSGIIKTD